MLAALEDAAVYEDTAVLLLVAAATPADVSDYAYVPPGHWGQLEHRVARDVGDRLNDFSDLHRFCVYAEIDAPEAGPAVGLRHEAQHAFQFNLYGPHFFYLESIMRRAMRRTGRMNEYSQIPSERDANRAAAAYAHARYPAEIGALAADVRFADLVGEPVAVADMLGETIESIWDYASRDEIDDQDAARRRLDEVVEEFAAAVRAWVPIDQAYRVRRDDGQPFLVEVEPALA